MEWDELWAFVGHKKRKAWRWSVVERASRQLVGWTSGSRYEAPLRRLWASLPRRYHRWYFTDFWKAYAKGLPGGPRRPCPQGKGQMRIVEAINCSLRQRCGVLASKSCSFSKSLALHTAQIKLVIDKYSLTLRLTTAYYSPKISPLLNGAEPTVAAVVAL